MPKKHSASNESQVEPSLEEKPDSPHKSKRIVKRRIAEMKIYEQVRGIFATSEDYSPKSTKVREFFQTVQNKLLWTVTGSKASEILQKRSDPSSPTLGLTSWKNKRINKSDVIIAKNYLARKEISTLRKKVSAFLAHAKEKFTKYGITNLAYWDKKVNKFLEIENPESFGPGEKEQRKAAKAAVTLSYDTFKNRNKEEKKAKAQRSEAVNDLTPVAGEQISSRAKKVKATG